MTESEDYIPGSQFDEYAALQEEELNVYKNLYREEVIKNARLEADIKTESEYLEKFKDALIIRTNERDAYKNKLDGGKFKINIEQRDLVRQKFIEETAKLRNKVRNEANDAFKNTKSNKYDHLLK